MNKNHDGFHKYLRDKFKSGTIIFKCVLPGCQHYLLEKFIEGKIAVCWRCSKDFVIGKAASKMKKPHCDDCYKGREVRRSPVVQEFVAALFGGKK